MRATATTSITVVPRTGHVDGKPQELVSYNGSLIVGLAQGITAFSVIRGDSPVFYRTALGFTVFSIGSVGAKLKGQLHAFPLLKLGCDTRRSSAPGNKGIVFVRRSDMDRIERIQEMEMRMDRAAGWLAEMNAAVGRHAAVREDIRALSAYYESDLWMRDYEADEAGILPSELKRGVLSEDGVYDLLTEYERLMSELRSLGAERE